MVRSNSVTISVSQAAANISMVTLTAAQTDVYVGDTVNFTVGVQLDRPTPDTIYILYDIYVNDQWVNQYGFYIQAGQQGGQHQFGLTFDAPGTYVVYVDASISPGLPAP